MDQEDVLHREERDPVRMADHRVLADVVDVAVLEVEA
jgi:hypothetical protein